MQRKVLVVDDVHSNRAILKKILSGDYAVLEAADGGEALELLRSHPREISAVLLDLLMPVTDGYEVLRAMHANPELAAIPVIVTTGTTEEDAEVRALSLGANDYITKPYNPAVILHRLRNTLKLCETAAEVNALQRDRLTGLYNRETFFTLAAERIAAQPPGYYVLSGMDIDNFKVVNDQYGSARGDEMLRHVADTFARGFEPIGGICCRVMADNFAVLYPRKFMDTPELEALHRALMAGSETLPTVSISIGRYLVSDTTLSVSAMYDRAVIAQSEVKGRFDTKVAVFDETMRADLLREQEIVTEMKPALESNQFEVWLQPQYNHATGALIGAEALVRWQHPQRGLIPPDDFISVFERNGFVYELDKYVWERACALLRGWLDAGQSPLPVAVNISRYDVLREDLLATIQGLVERYRIPPELLRLEITESAFAKASEQIIEVVRSLTASGFTVEIDDFGSGYSSLNTLKDVPANVLKLDMRFLEDSGNSTRGGNILESVVRMAKWLGMSVIAEGVETKEQADYLLTIGCSYVQGYLYSRPLSVAEYEALAARADKEEKMLALETVETLDNNAFWDPKSMETLIFNSYVGGACIFEFHNEHVELLRANRKYALALGGPQMTLEEALRFEWSRHIAPSDRPRVLEAIHRAIETGDEVTFEAEYYGLSAERPRACLRATARVIARAGARYLLYCTNEDITEQRKAEQRLRESDEQLRFLNDTAADLLARADPEAGLESVLKKTLDYFGGSRAYIFEYKYEENLCANTYEVCAPGVTPFIDRYTRFPLQTAWYWLKAFQTSDFFRLEDADALGEDRAEEREVLRTLNAHSTLAVSLRAGGKVIGTMGVFNPTQRLSDYDNLAALGDYVAVILTRRDLNAKIESNSEMLRNLMNDTPGGFARMEVRPDGSLVLSYVNDGFCALLGLSEEEHESIRHRNMMEDVHPEDRGAVYAAITEALHGGGRLNVKYRLRQSGGGYLWVMVFGRLTEDEYGNRFLNMYYTDMSEQLRLEEQRRELMENLPCGAGIYQISGSTLTAIYLNRRHDELIGKHLGCGTSVLDRVHPEDRARLLAELHTAIAEDRDGLCDVRVRHDSGEYRSFQVYGNIVERGAGTAVIYVTFTPIAAEELSYHEMLPVALAAMMESSPDLSFVKDRNFTYICCSRTFAHLVGLQHEREIVGKTDYDLFDRELADSYRADDIRLFEGGVSLVDYLERIPAGDRGLHYSRTSKYLLHDAFGTVIGFYGTGRDVTEFREAYSRLKLLTDSIPGGLATYACSPAGNRIIYFNDGFCKLLGCSREAYERLSADSPVSTVFAEDLPDLLGQLETLMRDGTPIDCTYRIHNLDGDGYKWINLRGVLDQRHGDTVFVNAVLYDVTRQIQTEEQLRVNAEEIRLSMARMGKMVLLYDVPARTLTMPEAYAKLYGLPAVLPDVPEAFFRGTTMRPEDADRFNRFYASILQGEKSGSAELCLVGADGAPRWEHGEFVTIFGSDDRPVKAVISVEDVTAQHSAQAESENLRRNEELLRLVVEHSARVIYRYDLATMEAVSVEPAASRSMGLPDYVPRMPESLIEQGVIFPEDADFVRGLFAAARGQRRTDSMRFRIRNAAGAVRWLDVKYTFINDDKTLTAAVISCLDITEQHEREVAFARYRQSADAARTDSVLYYESDITADLVEKQGGAMMTPAFNAAGSAYTQLIDRFLQTYFRENDRETAHKFLAREHLLALYADGQRELAREWKVVCGDQTDHWIRSNLQMVADPFTGHIKLFSQIHDISAEKQSSMDMQKRAALDGMTDLLNRTTAEERIRALLQQGGGERCMLLLLDLDDLKGINDSLGHMQGDAAIRAVAGAIRASFRRTDLLCRAGGDEFMIFLPAVTNEAQLRGAIGSLIRRVADEYVGPNCERRLQCSVGCATGTMGTDSFETLFQHADTALYHVKRNGKNNFIFYTPEMQQTTYQYTGHRTATLRDKEMFGKSELQRLLDAISLFFPLILSVNLTQNDCYLMEYQAFNSTALPLSGPFDDFVEISARTIREDEREAYRHWFGREALLAAFARGEESLHRVCHQRDDTGVYRPVEVSLVFYQAENGDVCEFSLVRAFEPGGEGVKAGRTE